MPCPSLYPLSQRAWRQWSSSCPPSASPAHNSLPRPRPLAPVFSGADSVEAAGAAKCHNQQEAADQAADGSSSHHLAGWGGRAGGLIRGIRTVGLPVAAPGLVHAAPIATAEVPWLAAPAAPLIRPAWAQRLVVAAVAGAVAGLATSSAAGVMPRRAPRTARLVSTVGTVPGAITALSVAVAAAAITAGPRPGHTEATHVVGCIEGTQSSPGHPGPAGRCLHCHPAPVGGGVQVSQGLSWHPWVPLIDCQGIARCQVQPGEGHGEWAAGVGVQGPAAAGRGGRWPKDAIEVIQGDIAGRGGLATWGAGSRNERDGQTDGYGGRRS